MIVSRRSQFGCSSNERSSLKLAEEREDQNIAVQPSVYGVV